jgi:hypothetical protein
MLGCICDDEIVIFHAMLERCTGTGLKLGAAKVCTL